MKLLVYLSSFMLLLSLGHCNDFDYYMFVRQWPGSFCENYMCPFLKTNDFTIHGLWPNFKNGSWPHDCLNKPFSEKTISDLISEMALEWPSLTGTNPQFWQHEWDKHGTCATKEFKNEREYFTTILSLHDQYDLKAALSAANIGPSKKADISSKSITAAVKAMFGYSPLLNCVGDSLIEIWICLDKNLRPFDCANVAGSSKCPSNIRMPPISGAGPSRIMKLSTGKARSLNFPENISNAQLLYCFIMLLVAPMILTFVKAAKIYFQASPESRLPA